MIGDYHWAVYRMRDIDEFKGDPEAWHGRADDFLLECLGLPLTDEAVSAIRAWFNDGDKWYA